MSDRVGPADVEILAPSIARSFRNLSCNSQAQNHACLRTSPSPPCRPQIKTTPDRIMARSGATVAGCRVKEEGGRKPRKSVMYFLKFLALDVETPA